MSRYLLRRVATAIPVLFGISLIVFTLVKLQPGDPFVGMVDPNSSPEQKQELLRRAGYDQPIPIQYLHWVSRAVLGDFGYSTQYGAPVLTVISSRLGNTLVLTLTSLALAALVAVPVGMQQALRRSTPSDLALSVFTFVALSIPTFFLGILLIKVFAADLGWLPASGVITVGAGYTGVHATLDMLKHLALPAVTLAVVNAASLTRYVRSAVSDILDQDFVATHFATGASRGEVLGIHVLKNAAKPLVTIISLELPSLLSGALLTETVFGWPGIGRLNYEAVQNRDYPLLMGIIMFLALAIVVANLVADLIYSVVDPRVRVNS
jgi:peptide/nickel transport system permease protein